MLGVIYREYLIYVVSDKALYVIRKHLSEIEYIVIFPIIEFEHLHFVHQKVNIDIR